MQVQAAEELGPASDYEIYLGYAFTGTKITVPRNSCHSFEVNNVDFNDEIRSVRVPPGGKITLWEHPEGYGPDLLMELETAIFLPLWHDGSSLPGSCARTTRICTGP